MKFSQIVSSIALSFSACLCGHLTSVAASEAVVPKASEWFKAEQVAPGTWRIDEHSGVVNIYLLIGSSRALLVDTGLGDADLVGFVRSLTTLPVEVINTHGHPDHVGGDGQFGKALACPQDFAAIKNYASPKRPMSMSAFFGINVPSAADRFNGEYKTTDLVAIADGQVIDLGDRKVEVIATPGHTAGEIVLLDHREKLLFTGDNTNAMVWLQLRDALPLETYLKSLEKVNARHAEYAKIMPGHGTPLEGDFIEDQIACVKQILAGTATSEAYHANAGDGRVAKSNRAAVVFNPENLRNAK
jgi:glyoxylase-like metal-dependent hydrolase (beta-lactamase superfamily II)